MHGVLITMHGRNHVTIDPRIPSMTGRSALDFHRQGNQVFLAPKSGAKREVFGESQEGRASSYYEPLVVEAFSQMYAGMTPSNYEGRGRGSRRLLCFHRPKRAAYPTFMPVNRRDIRLWEERARRGKEGGRVV